MTKQTLILVPGYDPGYLRVYEHLVRKAIVTGNQPVVLDITATSAVPTDSFHRPTLNFFHTKYPGHDLQERLENLGASYVKIEELLSNPKAGELTAENQEILDISIQSALITYYRTDDPRQSVHRIGATAKRLRSEGEDAYFAVLSLLKSGDFESAYLPNGRFPHQKMATIAAREAGVQTFHYEKGETPNGAYVQPYAPQDRLASQGAVDPILVSLSSTEIDEIADEWLAKRAPAIDSRNEFSAGWTNELPPSLSAKFDGKRKVVGFFTSSQDEFQFLGPEWQLHTWESQFAAFDMLLTLFEEQGYICYLRVHPNLATKAHECFLREREGSAELARRHPNLSVIWHDDTASTYALLENTDAVIVWDSTVGLEASARGIPVWTCATSRYGLIADVKELLGPEQIKEDSLNLWEVDTHKAKKFITYLVKRDDQMAPVTEPWLSWDPANPPFHVKLAAVFVSGGTPSIRDALTATFDVWRHRRMSFNKKQIRSKIS